MSIKVTEKALMEFENLYRNTDLVFRIMIAGFGWSGPTLGVNLEKPMENDYIEEINGIKFAVDRELLEQYKNFKIDYVKNMFKKGFVVSSNAIRPC